MLLTTILLADLLLLADSGSFCFEALSSLSPDFFGLREEESDEAFLAFFAVFSLGTLAVDFSLSSSLLLEIVP